LLRVSFSWYFDSLYVADLAEQQTKNNMALKQEVVLSPLLESIIILSTA